MDTKELDVYLDKSLDRTGPSMTKAVIIVAWMILNMIEKLSKERK